jgi:hypothetical protein
MASAAAIAVSAYALPVYEIYKVGEDLHWKQGLDFFGAFGLPLIFIPHWNNNDGGDELDTSRCFMGQTRFSELMQLLPSDLTVLGIDEKTALILDIYQGTARVIGLGEVTLIHTGHQHRRGLSPDLNGTGLEEVAQARNGHIHQYLHGQIFPLSECCPFELPDLRAGIPEAVWQTVLAAQPLQDEPEKPPPQSPLPDQVQALVKARQDARAHQDWAAADALRRRIGELGWQVIDTPDGPQLQRGHS